jgi:WD40 repeat protein
LRSIRAEGARRSTDTQDITAQRDGEPLTGHVGGVSAVAVGELDGRPIAVSGSNDRTLRMWDLGGSELAAIEVGSAIRAVRMRSPTILVGADAGVIVLELMPAKPPA